jgi:hypothetical protein
MIKQAKPENQTLRLAKENIRKLTAAQLGAVAGGVSIGAGAGKTKFNE